MIRIPLIDIVAQDRDLQPELESVVKKILSSGKFILGENVSSFEGKFAEYNGCQYGVGVNCGTDALEVALRACGVKAGDEVIVPSFTFIASALAISTIGAVPVMADIESESFGINVSDAKERITSKTKAIMPVHLYGQACDMDGVMSLAKEHNLQVVEDCAQAIGAHYKGRPVGSMGDAGCFSFYPTKNLGAAGDGGAIVTKDEALATKARLIRTYGTRDKITYSGFGRNTRLDEIQAAILTVKLKYLDGWNKARRERADWYRQMFAELNISGIRLPSELSDRRHVYHLFVIRVPERDVVHEKLAERGIHTMIHYRKPLNRGSFYAGKQGAVGSYPVADAASNEVLAIPMHPTLDRQSAQTVVDQIAEIVKELNSSSSG